MQNGFQFCPTVVLCFIIIKNVTNILPAGSIFFPSLFQSYSKSVIAYFTVHVSRDRQGGAGQGLLTSWCSECVLLKDSGWVGVQRVCNEMSTHHLQ